MIAADTSALASFLRGDTGQAVDKVADALVAGDLMLPPVVVTEILSDQTSANTSAGTLSAKELAATCCRRCL